MQQTCKNCGAQDAFNFNVSDSVWEKVVPAALLEKVVCLACFDRFAEKRGIDYRRNLRVIYFAGRQASFKFRVVRSSKALRS